MPVHLPRDIVQCIVDQLAILQDHRTLGRLMLVSQDVCWMAATALYKDPLGPPGISDYSSSRVAFLMLYCAGCLNGPPAIKPAQRERQRRGSASQPKQHEPSAPASASSPSSSSSSSMLSLTSLPTSSPMLSTTSSSLATPGGPATVTASSCPSSITKTSPPPPTTSTTISAIAPLYSSLPHYFPGLNQLIERCLGPNRTTVTLPYFDLATNLSILRIKDALILLFPTLSAARREACFQHFQTLFLNRHFATLSSITLEPRLFKDLLPLAGRMQSLTTLSLKTKTGEISIDPEEFSVALEFVDLHQRQFPGQLTKIHHWQRSAQAKYYLDLFRHMIHPPKSLVIDQLYPQDVVHLEQIPLETLTEYFMGPDSPTRIVWDHGRLLQRCRKLEQANISVHQPDLFAWAAQEKALLLAQEERDRLHRQQHQLQPRQQQQQQQIQIQYQHSRENSPQNGKGAPPFSPLPPPPSSSSSSSSLSIHHNQRNHDCRSNRISLVPLRVLTLTGSSDVVIKAFDDAVNAFSDTLESISLVCLSSHGLPLAIYKVPPHWSLPHITDISISGSGCSIGLSSQTPFHHLTSLQRLSLSSRGSSSSNSAADSKLVRWKGPPSLLSLVLQGQVASQFDMDSLPQMTKLTLLRLESRAKFVKSDKTDYSWDWYLPALQTLELSSAGFQFRLLLSCPKLTSLHLGPGKDDNEWRLDAFTEMIHVESNMDSVSSSSTTSSSTTNATAIAHNHDSLSSSSLLTFSSTTSCTTDDNTTVDDSTDSSVVDWIQFPLERLVLCAVNDEAQALCRILQSPVFESLESINLRFCALSAEDMHSILRAALTRPAMKWIELKGPVLYEKLVEFELEPMDPEEHPRHHYPYCVVLCTQTLTKYKRSKVLKTVEALTNTVGWWTELAASAATAATSSAIATRAATAPTTT